MKHSSIEPEPPYAEALCGQGIDKVRRFARELGTRGEELGLIGPDEARRLWTRHVLNCALLAPELPSRNEAGGRVSVADVGSGAGLPGLVIAMVRPDTDVVLIEPLERRTRWLTEQIDTLDLENVTVFTGRAEDYRPRHTFDVVTARAVKSLKGLVPMLTPLLAPGGRLALLKGRRVDDELAEAGPTIRRCGVIEVSIRPLGEGVLPEPTRLFSAKVD